MSLDTVIYTQVNGKLTRTANPIRNSPSRRNFVIMYKAMDWSGFRTLAECEAQFPEIEAKAHAKDDLFSVVER